MSAQAERLPLLGNALHKRGKASLGKFLRRFWPTGIVGFGGPQAHVALMHSTFVDTPTVDKDGNATPHVAEAVFLELYALCQSLPGPGSTQLATTLGATFGGLLGGLITFFTFFMPGFIVMTLAGVWYHGNLAKGIESASLIRSLNEYLSGLIAAAFAMVALAAYKIVTKCDGDDGVKWMVTVIVTTVAVCVSPAYASATYIGLLMFGGLVALVQKLVTNNRLNANGDSTAESREQANANQLHKWESGIRPIFGLMLVSTFIACTGLAIISNPKSRANHVLKVFWTMGAISVGGGIVIIPMLLNEIVETGMLPNEVFLAGFALVGCVPGPMFNLAAFLGAAIAGFPGALRGAFGLFAPGIIIVLGLLPFWEQVRKKKIVRDIVQGVNSAASGLIVAGVWMLLKRVMVGPASFSLAVSAGVAMTVFKVSSPIAIALHGGIGALFVLLGIGGPFVKN